MILGALVEAGVDVLDASIRRFDAPAFEGSELTLAGWAKKLTGAVSMAVGSVGLDKSLRDAGTPGPADLDGLLRRLEDEEFDLVAIGRHTWPIRPSRRSSATAGPSRRSTAGFTSASCTDHGTSTAPVTPEV